jgi:hypothetical protein
MSLLKRVVQLVRELDRPEGVDVNDLHPHCPGRTRIQVMQALHNAANRRHISLVTPCQRPGFGVGSIPGKYSPAAPKPKEYPLTSVFDMGQRAIEGRPYWTKRVPRQDFSTPEHGEAN